MAEEVKTNSRKRRPPSYLIDVFQDDSIKGFANEPVSRPDIPSQDTDLCSIPIIARLLCKLINSSNKKLQDKATKMMEEKDKTSFLKLKEDRLRSNSNYEEKNILSESESEKMKNQEESKEKICPISLELKERERLPHQETTNQDQQIRDGKLPLDLFVDKPTLQETLTDPKTTHKSKEKNYKKSISKKISKEYKECNKNDETKTKNEKIFKRAAFHIGIAYNTHFQKIQTLNHHFGVNDLDPTFLSKRLRVSKISSISITGNEPKEQNVDDCNINNLMIYQSNYEMAEKLKNREDEDRERTGLSIGKEIKKKEGECEAKMENE